MLVIRLLIFEGLIFGILRYLNVSLYHISVFGLKRLEVCNHWEFVWYFSYYSKSDKISISCRAFAKCKILEIICELNIYSLRAPIYQTYDDEPKDFIYINGESFTLKDGLWTTLKLTLIILIRFNILLKYIKYSFLHFTSILNLPLDNAFIFIHVNSLFLIPYLAVQGSISSL